MPASPSLYREKKAEMKVAPSAPPALVIKLAATDPARAGQAIAEEVRKLDGTVTTRHDHGSPPSLTARLEARRLPELIDRLARLGTLQEKPAIRADMAGMVECTISW